MNGGCRSITRFLDSSGSSFSDALLARLVSSTDLQLRIQHYKGWLFVFLSALLIFFTLKSAWGKQKEAVSQKVEMEFLFQKLFETNLDGILMTTPDGEVYAANAAACKILQRSEEEIIRVGRKGIMDPTDFRLENALERRRSTGSFSGELTMIRGDGSKLEVEMSSVIFPDRFGNNRTNIVFRDLTERKLREKQLLEVNQRFTQVLDSITDAFIILDQDWSIIYVNREAAIINKKNAEEILGESLWEEWPASTGTLLEDKFRWAMKNRKSVHFEHRYFDEGLFDVWLEIHAYPFEQGLAVYYHDITEKKRLGDQLQGVHDRLNQTLESMTDAFILLDNEWRVTYMNAQAAKRQNLPLEEIIGKTHWEIWPMTQGSEVETQYRWAVEQGKPVHFEFHYYARGEYDEWHDIHAYPSEAGLAVFYADITKRKKAQEALKEIESRPGKKGENQDS